MKPRSATMPYCRAPPARASAVCVRVGRDRERAVPDATLVRLSLAEAADLIQRRALSPVERLEAVLARIALVDARLNAFTTLVPVEEARAAARAAEREIAAGTYRGPLHGIPAGVKDLLDTAGLRTTYGSGMFRDYVPSVDGDSSFSVPGPLARTVRDAAIVAQAIAGFDPAYAYSRPGPVPDLLQDLEAGVAGLRIGTSRDALRPQPDPAVDAAYAATRDRLAALGARVVDVRLPHHDLVLPVVLAVFAIEGEVALEARLGGRPRLFSPQVARMREMMPPGDAASWMSAQRQRQLVCRDYAAAFVEVDALVLPTTPFPAPRIDGDETRLAGLCAAYTGAANLTGLPAVAIPAGSSDGLPVGVQIVAPAGRDALALRIARALEKTAAEHRVHPPPDGG